MSYKVMVLAVGEKERVSNALRFATREQAEAYGSDLASRWTGVKSWIVEETPDPVTEG